ncbi:MAG: nicotinate-nucleotide--dimethylbenzimidazole phosphoribosyltransferase [Deltaproteobacteria bacterium]|nr:nicotinate-nucleotide--dimethylbenzimidazole phosphoribosyltransferase [Deltaproteobacteria bacterium]
MSKLDEALKEIKPVNPELMAGAQQRLDCLTKPKDSLGRLEEFARRMVAITGQMRPAVRKRIIFTFAADHGVADEGVSAFPKEVTRQMVLNFLGGGAGINVLARHAGAEVKVIDIGVDHEFDEADGLIRMKVVNGTANMRKGPAMTREEAEKCIEAGISLAREHAGPGVIFGTGEMGIANTTPASAMVSAFTGASVEDVTGRGTGIDDRTYETKLAVIKDALKMNRPDASDPLGVLAKVGGAEIAGIAGLIIGASAMRTPIVVDGFISTAGALCAYRMNPAVKDYIFASHNSVEKGHRIMLESMGLDPILDLNLRLGEGTGAALAMTIIEAGVKIYNEMATFGEAGVSEEKGQR